MFCKCCLPLNSILQVCAGLSSVLYSWLVSPPTHRRRCSRGWPNKPLFTNINFTRQPFLQFWFAPKLRSTVSCYLSTQCCSPGVFVLPPPPPPPSHTMFHERVSQQVPSQKYGSYMEFTRQPFLQFWFAPKPGFTVLCCPSALCCTHWLSLHDAVQLWVAQQAHFQKHGI